MLIESFKWNGPTKDNTKAGPNWQILFESDGNVGQ